MTEEAMEASPEPIWLTTELVVAFHGEQLQRFGGPPGIRDFSALESALGRPRNKWAYEGAGMAECAAAYGFGVARNHPFVDGNKRAALLSIVVFLGLNGIEFMADEAQFTVMIQNLAAGTVDEEGLTRWIRDNWPADAPA
jgi:death on curing protein